MIFPLERCKINRVEILFLRYNGLNLACWPPKLCIFIAKAVYLGAISMTKYELFFKLLYVFKFLYISLSMSVKKITLVFLSLLEVMIPNKPSDWHFL